MLVSVSSSALPRHAFPTSHGHTTQPSERSSIIMDSLLTVKTQSFVYALPCTELRLCWVPIIEMDQQPYWQHPYCASNMPTVLSIYLLR